MKTQNSSSQLDTAALKRIQIATKLLEGLIKVPGTDKKIGIDPIIGLLTGGGDSMGFIMSAYIMLESLRFKLPKETLLRMLANVAIDAIVGAVPFLGDVFDFFWKSNTKNIKLLEAHLANPIEQKAADKLFVALVLVALGLLFAMAIGLTIAVASLIAKLFAVIGW
ncbi:MAG: hypothetical protein RLZZ511_302 [Cyanobacteriota bacterium]|jgi:predicted histidine transporter YuiF (NhaC family)